MTDNPCSSNGTVVVGLGEVLFDCFSDRKVLGGAPLNVAVHAHQLLARSGGRGAVVSRIGNDELGRKIIEQLSTRGIDAETIQTDSQLPTGTVQVSVTAAGEPTYVIEEGVAWEQLRFDESLEKLASDCSAVCFGSLAQRSEPSRTTIHQFLAAASSAIRVFDVNLRQDFYTAEILNDSFEAATVVKLNHDELAVVRRLLSDKFGGETSTDSAIRNLQESYDLDCVAITRGKEGTVLYYQGNRFETAPIAIERAPNADNVGAGDACSAGLVYGLLMKWKPQQILELANRMGAFVASQVGATPKLPANLLDFALTK